MPKCTSLTSLRVIRLMLAILSIALSSCLKNADKTADGPKNRIVAANYSVNANDFVVVLNDVMLTTSPLAFGASTGTAGSLYMPVGAGLQRLLVSSGGTMLVDKTIMMTENTSYSVFLYDSVKPNNSLPENRLKIVQMTDAIEPIDTLGRLRFLQFIPGEDSLEMVMVKNAVGVSITEKYIGNINDAASEGNFNYGLPPGTYKLLLMKNNLTLYERDGVVILPGKVYSIISKGVSGATGNYRASVDLWQHN